ncbi:MAG: AmmeMemoRadiSam system protein B, partial [Treponema sp.]|nr:AmmeMemoRadiSam system protein B [Treponema sp.]
MNTRKPLLPPGWYPRTPQAIKDFLRGELATSEASFKRVSPLASRLSCPQAGQDKPAALPPSAGVLPPRRHRVIAAAAPHAGWYYSGAIAAKALEALASGALASPGGGNWTGTVAVIGGHLPPGVPALFAPEDAVETPLGSLEMDGELRASLGRDLPAAGLDRAPDCYTDNTVEVLLPMVKYFFPAARLLWLRLP